jgi:ABC-type lipoprotein release transport system permease subunit
MRALRFAARSLFRQPARAGLGLLGIAAVGALLFDMLLLSRGLVVSFRDLLDRVGFDVRVMTTDVAPLAAPRLTNASEVARRLRTLPEIASAAPLQLVEAEISRPGRPPLRLTLSGVDAGERHPWTRVSGQELAAGGGPPSLVISQTLARVLGKGAGDEVMLRPVCDGSRTALPAAPFTIAGLADFPFDDEGQLSAAALRGGIAAACGGDTRDEADMVLIASREGYGPDAAVRAIARAYPVLHATTNEEVVRRMQDQGFTYFRQISTVLSSITMLFGFLLITVLLTVSVNQRIGEIAAIRALGFSRARVASDVLWQSVLLVGIGGILAVPLGFVLSLWLDRILKAMPGIPLTMHFFVFEPRALLLHGSLLTVTAIIAAAYPIWLVTTLPIAATLRNEVVS